MSLDSLLETTGQALTAEHLLIDDILVGERFRKEYNKIDELCASITQFGLMHYPVVDQNNNLVAGGRRLTALRKLGWTMIPVTRKENLDEQSLREMELEENLQRENLTWQEEVNLKNEILKLKQEKFGIKPSGRAASTSDGVSQKDVAEMLGESPSNFNMDIELARLMEEVPELANCGSKDEARKWLKNFQEKAIVEELGRRHKATATINIDPKTGIATREQPVQSQDSGSAQQTKQTRYPLADAAFIVGDALEGLKSLEKNPNLRFINVDTPYGIDLNAIKRDNNPDGVKIIDHNYQEWAIEDFINKCRTVAEECYRVAADDCTMMWWFAIQWYEPLKKMLTEVGWQVDPIPNIWDTGDQGQTNQPELYLARCYEPFFSCRKGKPVIFKRGRSNIFRHKKLAGDKKIHPTEKPLSLMKEIWETYAQPGCHVLIPFIGSGNDLLTSFVLNHPVMGFDLNAEVKKRYLIRFVEMERGNLL